MAYQKHQELLNVFKQELFVDLIEIEIVLEEHESPVEEKPQEEKYELSPRIPKKSILRDRKMRRKSFIKLNRPVSSSSVTDRWMVK